MNKNTKLVHYITQRGELHTKYITNVEIIPREMDMIKILKWNFHVDELQRKHRYDMVLCHGISSELKTDLCLYN